LPVARETANLLQSDHHEVIVGKNRSAHYGTRGCSRQTDRAWTASTRS
jgi:hypothetical protein